MLRVAAKGGGAAAGGSSWDGGNWLGDALAHAEAPRLLDASAAFDAIVALYRASDDAGERQQLLGAVGRGADGSGGDALAQRALAFCLSAAVRSQDIVYAIASLCATENGAAAVWVTLTEQWEIMQEKVCSRALPCALPRALPPYRCRGCRRAPIPARVRLTRSSSLASFDSFCSQFGGLDSVWRNLLGVAVGSAPYNTERLTALRSFVALRGSAIAACGAERRVAQALEAYEGRLARFVRQTPEIAAWVSADVAGVD